MRVTPVDPVDPTAVGVYAGIRRRSAEHDSPHATPWADEETRTELKNLVSAQVTEGCLGTVDGVAVAAGRLAYSVRDNTDKVWLEPTVDPAYRRRGFGTSMLGYLERRADGLRRPRRLAEVTVSLHAGPKHPLRAYAERRGYTFADVEVHRTLELPVDDALLDGALAAAEPHHRAYPLRQYVGLPPDELLPSYVDLLNAIMTDAPTGEVDYEAGRLTTEDLRDEHRALVDQGRTMFTTVALDGAGQAVAHSQLVVPEHDPDRIFQWDTLVHRDHRGHRLGLATKALNLGWVQRLHPRRRSVHTGNAAYNTHMIAVNDALGFVPVDMSVVYQRVVSP